ncbi:ATP-binding cassette domain-containing protein [Saccharibacter sp. 17.LH.SD]|uniref:ABC transporter ATP-binding protein n=1 Tax=Saccharibacter sp. 17.LH.SD TaxID=2689393 RepID=UPI00136A0DE4|nr:ABC transporter ATP-binding protein [Saccharibacter sp. 17.LH.SD]MXV44691.1 ATP-binding cassette domain-containing protein [Saccharibacter sp. 17.LH.SD]
MSLSAAPISKLCLRQLSKSFPRSNAPTETVEVLRGLNLDIQAGEFVVIVGPSGCGKSTLLDLLAGLETPSHGNIFLDGNPAGPPGKQRSVVFQNYALLPWKTAFENVSFALKTAPLTQKEKREKTLNALSLVGLSHATDRYPHHLSGGMKQRVAIARSLVVEPDVLLMDEPFAALDAQTREILQEEVRALWQRNHTTIIFITHDIDEALILGQRVIIMNAHPGTIQSDITLPFQSCLRTEEIRNSPEYARLRTTIRTSLLPKRILNA